MRRLTVVCLWMTMLLALACRCIVLSRAVAGGRLCTTERSREYQDLAKDIATGWGRGRTLLYFHGLEYPPGYPVLLASVRLLSERVGLEGRGLEVALWIQVLVDVHVVLLVYWLCQVCGGPRVGLAGALFYAVDPFAVSAACTLLPHTLSVALLTGSVCLLVRHLTGGGAGALLLSSAALGSGCYLLPAGLVVAPALASPLAVVRAPYRLARGLTFLLLTGLILSPWVVRNRCVEGFTGFSSSWGDALYYGLCPSVLHHGKGILEAEGRELLVRRERNKIREIREESNLFPRHRAMSFFEALSESDPPSRSVVRRAWRSETAGIGWRQGEALRIIRDHPWATVTACAGRCLSLCESPAGDLLCLTGYGQAENAPGSVWPFHAALAAHDPGAASEAGATAMVVLADTILVAQYVGIVLALVHFGQKLILPRWLAVGAAVAAGLVVLAVFNGSDARILLGPVVCAVAGGGWGLRFR